MAENNEISENVAKVLFAEDLMNHVMNYTVQTAYKAMSVERYRNFVHNAFNEKVREATTFMYREVHMEIMNFYLVMLHINSVNLTTYTAYAKIISTIYFKDKFNVKGFLHYCARLAGLAMYFYKHGIVEAPNAAITYIVNALSNAGVTTSIWAAALNRVSRQIANVKNNTLNQLPQQPTSDKEAPVSISGCNCFINDYKSKIQIVLAKAFHQIPNCSCSPENKEDSNESKKCSTTPFMNSPNFGENEVVEPLSDGIIAPGTTNTSGMSVRSMKDEPLDLTSLEINHEMDQTVPPPTDEKKSSMLEIASKSKRHISDSEENSFPNKKS